MVSGRTVFDGSGIAEVSGQVAARANANMNTRSWIAVIWCGHNDIELGTPGQVVPNIASIVNTLAPADGNRFIVVSLDNAATARGIRGGADYNTVMQINAQLQAAYPNNYLDMRGALVAHYDPSNPQDVADHNNDVPPSSLRYDEIHLAQPGSAYAAQLIRDFIVAKGW
jgi:hypothetical protein